MIDKQLFLTGIQEQVTTFHGLAYVRVVTQSSDYLVRDIVKTYDGAVTLNVWLDTKGFCPIVAGSSSFYEFDVRPVLDYKSVTIPFEQIIEVPVVPAVTEFGKFRVI